MARRANRAAGALVFCVLSLLRSVAAGMYSDSDNMVLIDSPETFKQMVHEADGLALVEFYAEGCSVCKSLAPQYIKVAKSMQGTVLVAAVDCSAGEAMMKLCKKVGLTGFPTIKLYGPGIVTNPYTHEDGKEVVEVKGRTARTIVDEVNAALTDTHIVMVKSESELKSAQESRPAVPKVLLFSNKDDAPNGYKGLSMALHGGMHFLLAHESSAELVQKFKIEDFPSLLLFKTDGSVEAYDGALKAGPLKEFLEPHVVASEKAAKKGSQGGKDASKNVEVVPKSLDDAMALDEDEPMWLLAIYGEGSSSHCTAELEAFQAIMNDMQALVKVASVEVKVAEAKQVSSRYGINGAKLKSDPCALQLLLLPFGTDKEDLDDYLVWSGPLEAKALGSWVTEAMPIMATEVNAMNFNHFVASLPDEPRGGGGAGKSTPRIVLFTNKEDIPGVYKALALNHRNMTQLGFGWCRTTVQENAPILDQFGVKKAPSLKMMLPVPIDPTHPEYVEGEERIGMTVQAFPGPYKYQLMAAWLSQLYTMWEQMFGPAVAAEAVSISKVEGTESFNQLCGQVGICVLGLFDGSETEEVEDLVDVLASVSQQRSGQPVGFAWADISVHGSLLQTFGVMRSSVPTVVAYSPRRLRYATMTASLSEKGVGEFLDGVLTGKARTEVLQEAPVLSASSVSDEPGQGDSSQGGDAAADELFEEEFDLSDIMSEEVEGSLGTMEERLRKIEEELAAEQALKDGEKKKKKKKKKTKKKDSGGKEEL